jgi:hypothetical protein
VKHVDWCKFFSLSSSEIDTDDFFSEFTVNGNFYGFPSESSQHLIDGDSSHGDDTDFHEYWGLTHAILTSVQEVWLLLDFHIQHHLSPLSSTMEGYDGDSLYAYWMTHCLQPYLSTSACDPKHLFVTKAGGDDEEEANKARVCAMMYFTAISNAFFSPNMVFSISPSPSPSLSDSDSDSHSLCVSKTVIDTQERIRKTLLQSFLQQENANQAKFSTWIWYLVKTGKGYPLEALANLFVVNSLVDHDAENADNDVNDKDNDKELKTLITTFLQMHKSTFENTEGLATNVGKILMEEIPDGKTRKLWKVYLSAIESFVLMTEKYKNLDQEEKNSWRSSYRHGPLSLFTGRVEVNYDSYESLAHYMVKENGVAQDDDDDDEKDGEGDKQDEKDEELSGEFIGVAETLQLFVESGADFSAIRVDECYGLPILSTAAQKGDLAAVKYLVKLGLDMDECGGIDDGNDPMYVCALSLAVMDGNLNMVKFLLKSGADVNASDGSPPLLFACQHTIHLTDGASSFSEEILMALLDAGADVETYKTCNYFNEEHIFPEALPLLGLDADGKKKKKRRN